jgi:F-type H+-transporting ATPase subunit beta
MDALSSDADRVLAGRARKLHAFLSQPFSITELWTNTIGEYVPLAWALDGVEAVLDGNLDDVDEAQLRSIAGTHLKIRR